MHISRGDGGTCQRLYNSGNQFCQCQWGEVCFPHGYAPVRKIVADGYKEQVASLLRIIFHLSNPVNQCLYIEGGQLPTLDDTIVICSLLNMFIGNMHIVCDKIITRAVTIQWIHWTTLLKVIQMHIVYLFKRNFRVKVQRMNSDNWNHAESF